jgi:hypothetical protein
MESGLMGTFFITNFFGDSQIFAKYPRMIFHSNEKILIKKLQLSSANQITPFQSDFSSESKLLTTLNVSPTRSPTFLPAGQCFLLHEYKFLFRKHLLALKDTFTYHIMAPASLGCLLLHLL